MTSSQENNGTSIDPGLIDRLVKRFGAKNLEKLADLVDEVCSDTGHGEVISIIYQEKVIQFKVTRSVKT